MTECSPRRGICPCLICGNQCRRHYSAVKRRSGLLAAGPVCSDWLRKNAFNHFAMDVGEAEVTALEAVRQLFMVDAQAVQDGRVLVVDVNRILHDVVAVIVGLSVTHATLDSSTG